jgi:Uri superfamily endonuclease
MGGPRSPGTYALMMRCSRAGTIAVGSLGTMRVEPGAYLYLGSAFGPGGLRARLGRHAARHKVQRWHIDYVRPRMSLLGAWFSTSATQLEHDWAVRVLALPTASIPLPRFGASDCRCPSHLVRLPETDSSHRSVADALGVSGAEPLRRLEAGPLRRLARCG